MTDNEITDIAAQAIQAAQQRGVWRVRRYEADLSVIKSALQKIGKMPPSKKVEDALAVAESLRNAHPALVHYLGGALLAIATEPDNQKPGPSDSGRREFLERVATKIDPLDGRTHKAPKVFGMQLGTLPLLNFCLRTARYASPALADPLVDASREIWAEYQGSVERLIDLNKPRP